MSLVVNRLDFHQFPNCRLSLTVGRDESERVPHSSGLNWGQRPGRNPDQAYLPVPAAIQRQSFFPEIGVTFMVLTDDGWQFACVRAQQNGKAIHSVKNSEMGSYFRQRLGVKPGELVTLQRLLHFGRTWVDFYRQDSNTFHLDFSPHLSSTRPS